MKQKNPFIFTTLLFAMAAIMYCIAFHSERNENQKLKKIILTK